MGQNDGGQRWLAIGRTDIERGFMAVNRAIFQPGRVALPGDGEADQPGCSEAPTVSGSIA